MKFAHLLIVFAMGLLLSFPAMATYTITDTPANGVVSVDDSGMQSVVSHAPADDGLVYSTLPGVDVPCNRCILALTGRMTTNLNEKTNYEDATLTHKRTWTRVMWPNSTELAHT